METDVVIRNVTAAISGDGSAQYVEQAGKIQQRKLPQPLSESDEAGETLRSARLQTSRLFVLTMTPSSEQQLK